MADAVAPTRTDRLLKALPAVGAVLGGALGAARPGLLDAGREAASLGRRAISGTLGAATGAGVGWLPDVLREGARAAMPAHKVVTAAARGRDLVHYMWDELELISQAQITKTAAYDMTLQPKAWDMGIYAKRRGEDQRGPAYATDVGNAAAKGAVMGIGGGALLGGPILSRSLTHRGRAAALEDFGKDLGSLSSVYARARLRATTKPLGELVKDVLSGNAPDAEKALGNAAHEIASEVASPEVKAIVARRVAGAGRAALTAGAFAAGVKGLHNIAQYEAARALTNKEKKAGAQPQALPQEEDLQDQGNYDPVAEILGTEVETLDKKRARGYPIIQAPPGYVFNPDLSAFVPDMSQPGWMSEEQAAQAQNNQGWFQQGQQTQATDSAQTELDQSVDAQAQELAGQQQAAQNTQMMQQVEAQKQLSKLQTPSSVSGAGAPAPKQPANPAKPKAKPTASTVTVKVGK